MAPILFLQSLLFVLTALCWAEIVNLRSTPAESRALINRIEVQQDYGTGPTVTAEGGKDEAQDLELLDIVLVATVDGKFHALNRTSGYTLWSMASTPSSNGGASSPSSLSPLVRTKHVDYDPDDIDDTVPETYIIEPQSGDIYVMTSPDSPLQRFPLSMAELVDMSPFSAPTENDKRVFIGRKETSLILLELETGKIKGTLNSECPPYEDKGIDLDELEDDDSRLPATTEVFIGRTDYHISIYTQQPGARQTVQNLSYSAYGPNNKDNILQASYRKTRDNSYIQNIGTNGEILSLKNKAVGGDSSFEAVWARNLEVPVVAVFDVLRGATPLQHHPHAFVLLQPRPRLQDYVLDQRSAFIGMVEETGSLFAMSRNQYPMLEDSSLAYTRKGRTVRTPGSDDYRPIDDIAKQTKKETEIHRLCEEYPGDRRCLLGMHPLDISNGHESRMKRLLEAPKSAETQVRSGQSQWTEPGQRGLEAKPLLGTIEASGNGSDSPGDSIVHPQRNTMLEAVGMTLFFGLLSLWFLFKRFRNQEGKPSSAPATADHVKHSVPAIPVPPQAVGQPLTVKQNGALPEADSDSVATSDEWIRVAPTPASTNAAAPAEEGDESDREAEGDGDATPVRRKPRRGKRGKKKKKKELALGTLGEEVEAGVVPEANTASEATTPQPLSVSSTPQLITPSSSLILTPPPQPETTPSLLVTDTILGYGSHGTVVFKGSLQGRAVAVKRLLKDFVTLASREVGILQDSDDHPNVIRYYYQEAHANFLYIALELCPASLADIIECPDRDQFRDIAISFDPKKALQQITSGLRHLHALKLVHRDIKPQNILVSTTKSTSAGRPVYRMLISDFGLTKRLDVDQTSFLPSTGGGMAAGTVGWRAPEILRGEVKLDDVSDENSISSRGSTSTIHGGSSGGSSSSTPQTGKPTRLTKSVDIFALGCLYYYTLTNGGHPYGDRFEREVNILRDAKSLDMLERFGEEGTEACNLIEQMLFPEAAERPDTATILLHPFFWDPGRRLNFLQDASDRFEIMCRDPRDPKLVELEKGSVLVVGNDWYSRLDKVFIENLGKFRKYDGKSVQDLLRALRNKKHHYQDLPDNVKRALGPMPEGYLAYFTKRYPNLFLHVHGVVKETGLRGESMFRSYFELPE